MTGSAGSVKVRGVYTELDKNRKAYYQKKGKPVPNEGHRRVDLGRSRTELPPDEHHLPFSFMVGDEWLAKNKEYTRLSFRENPTGFAEIPPAVPEIVVSPPDTGIASSS